MHAGRAVPRRWRKSLNPAQGALHTSADADEDAVFCSKTLVLQLSCCFPFSLRDEYRSTCLFRKNQKCPLYSFPKIHQN